MRASWRPLAASWARLGASWAHLEASWSVLDASGSVLDMFCRRPERIMLGAVAGAELGRAPGGALFCAENLFKYTKLYFIYFIYTKPNLLH